MLVTSRHHTPADGVTVIVLAYRATVALRECLDSLRSHRSDTPFSVVVVDNGASDPVRAVLADNEWVRVVRSRANRGFAGGCNLGAAHATGTHYVFLNDDAVVQPGWLDALVGFARSTPDAGAVGSLVTASDGSVLEGGASFDDGLHPYDPYRGTDAADALLRGPLRTAYVSGCSLCTPADVFNRLGGFDTGFHPAYFEDADYCLRAGQLGGSSWLVPSSVVRHAESSSTAPETRMLMWKRSWHRFRARWLATYGANGPGARSLPCPASRADPPSPAVDTVVVVDDAAPSATAGSGLSRTAETLEALRADGAHVMLHTTNRTLDGIGDLDALRDVTVIGDPVRALRDAVSPVLVVSRPHNLAVVEAALDTYPDVPFIYEAEALFSRRLAREALLASTQSERERVERAAAEMSSLEHTLARRADVVVTISEDEADWFRTAGARDVRVVEAMPDRARPDDTPLRQRRDALLVCGWLAGSDSPNADAVRWLNAAVLPNGDRRLVVDVTGANPPDAVTRGVDERIRFVGVVPDLDQAHARRRVALAPIRFGAGVKLKVVDALVRALPVVTTSVGAEGIHGAWRDGMVIADEPDAFAAAWLRLMTDDDEWTHRHLALTAAASTHTGDRVAAWRAIVTTAKRRAALRAARAVPTGLTSAAPA